MSYVTDGFDNKVVRLLRQGGVGLIPTDTIYGLSCRALDRTAVKKIHKLKGRDSDKPFIVLISDIKMLDLLSISTSQAKLAEKFWPGALSVVLKAPGSPTWLQLGSKSIAVRIPDNQNLLDLINKVGPIVSTSANRQGQGPAKSVDEAKTVFSDELDFYVDTGNLNNPPSTLAVIKAGRLQVVRQGAVKIS